MFFSHVPLRSANVFEDIKVKDEPFWLAVENATWRKVSAVLRII